MKFKPYPRYKDSGIEWLGKVPEHWDVVPLKWRIRIKSGDGLTSVDIVSELDKENQIPVIGGNGLIGYTHSVNIFSKTLVVGRVGALCGNVHEVLAPAYVTDNALILSVQNNSISIKYLGASLQARNLNEIADKTAQPLITGARVKAELVPFPPLAEQNSITNFLDLETRRIDALVEEKNRFIELLKEKRQALISHAVTKGLDPSVKMKDSGVEWLGEVPEDWVISALKHKIRLRYGDSLASEIRVDGEIEVFGSNGPVGLHCAANTKAPAIVVGRKGSYGRIVWAENGGFVIDTAYAIDSETTSLNLRWVYYELQPLGLDSLSQDTGVPGLARENAYGIKIAVPPSHEQTAIANFLDRETTKIDALITETQNSIALLKEHRTALISAAVTGKIDVRESGES